MSGLVEKLGLGHLPVYREDSSDSYLLVGYTFKTVLEDSVKFNVLPVFEEARVIKKDHSRILGYVAGLLLNGTNVEQLLLATDAYATKNAATGNEVLILDLDTLAYLDLDQIAQYIAKPIDSDIGGSG